MKSFIYGIAMVVLVGCNHSTNNQPVAPVSHVDFISNRTIRLMNLFKCDSLVTRYHTIHTYFTHSKLNFDPLQTEQFTNHALALIEFDHKEIDSIVYHYSSKRMQVTQETRMETVHDFYANRVIYNSFQMNQILNKIFLYERESKDNLFLNDLNTDFAVAKHGEEISKRAEIGIDAIEIIYNYIEEHKSGTLGENNRLVELYEKEIQNKEGENKVLHEKLLKSIHLAVGK